MARRKVAVVQDKRHCYWYGDFLVAIAAAGVEITGKVKGQRTAFGWIDSELIQTVEALPEVRMINDDYAYLVQEDN